MAYIALTLLILVHAVSWVLDGNRRIQHSPVKMTTILSGLNVIPHYIICTIDPENSFLYATLGTNYVNYFIQFGILYSVAFLLHTFFLINASKLAIPLASKLPLKDNYPYGKVVLFCFVSYVSIVLLYFSSMGGLFNYLGNFIQRDELRAGLGIFDMFRFPFAYLTIMFLVASFKDKPNSSLKFLLLIIISMALIEALFGGRRNPIQFLIFGYLGFLIVDRKQRIRPMSNIIIASLIVTIFVGLYYFRSLITLQAASPYAESAEIPVLTYLLNLSYNDIYIFVMSHFSSSNFWFGSIYADIVLKIASYISGSEGPSPDEGLYIYNLYLGFSVEPPMQLDQMAQNSWPPRTFGNGYLNFGILGVLIFFSIKGALVGLAYKVMTVSRNNPIFMYIYFYMIFSFQLSNLKIFEFITMVIALTIIQIPLRLLSHRKARPLVRRL